MRIFPCIPWTAVVAVLVAAPFSFPRAQGPTSSPSSPNNYPSPLPRRQGPSPPAIDFRVLANIPLPGPLPGGPPRLVGAEIHIPVAGGVAATEPNPDARPRIEPPREIPEDTGPAGPSPWIEDEKGHYRFRTLPEGRLEAQRRSRFRERWRDLWSLRVPGETRSPPLLLGRRLFYATRNDEVLAVRHRNGHRLWSADVGDRVSRPLELWTGSVHAPDSGEQIRLDLLLVTPDGGASLIALDPHDGRRVATFDLPASEGRLATGALATSDGKVVLGREGYDAADASLLVLSLESSPGPALEESVAYDRVEESAPGLQ